GPTSVGERDKLWGYTDLEKSLFLSPTEVCMKQPKLGAELKHPSAPFHGLDKEDWLKTRNCYLKG
ncbi:unnamed protein product, partial [Caretta caretta]